LQITADLAFKVQSGSVFFQITTPTRDRDKDNDNNDWILFVASCECLRFEANATRARAIASKRSIDIERLLERVKALTDISSSFSLYL
jgi:hypothetical protein